jgi:hypothetical protein
MRGKIIGVFAVIVLIVGGLAYALTWSAVSGASRSSDAPRALAGAVAQLQVDGLVLERWLAAQAQNPALRELFDTGTQGARAEAATAAANRLRDLAVAAPELGGLQPALVVFVDDKGGVLGRNGSARLMQGDDLGAVYPALKTALSQGATGSDVWVNRKRTEQLLASYSPIRDAAGKVVGGLVVGTALNDERMSALSNRTSGRILVVATRSDAGLDVVAKSRDATPEVLSALTAEPSQAGALGALTSGQVTDLAGLPERLVASSRTLDGYGDGRRAVLIAAAEVRGPGANLLWPALGAIGLGLVLVVAGGFFLDAYISRPVSEIEDGLLAIMNGRTDLRFELEHAVLGGLVFRLNSLLNQLLGVQEDDTDDEGRPSHAPTANSFHDALAVDERMAAAPAGENGDARALRAERDEDYYGRVFAEYIRAKDQLGDPTGHITKAAFIGRIQASEREMSDKHGKPVRYKVEVRDREVVLLAVPLA